MQAESRWRLFLAAFRIGQLHVQKRGVAEDAWLDYEAEGTAGCDSIQRCGQIEQKLWTELNMLSADDSVPQQAVTEYMAAVKAFRLRLASTWSSPGRRENALAVSQTDQECQHDSCRDLFARANPQFPTSELQTMANKLGKLVGAMPEDLAGLLALGQRLSELLILSYVDLPGETYLGRMDGIQGHELGRKRWQDGQFINELLGTAGKRHAWLRQLPSECAVSGYELSSWAAATADRIEGVLESRGSGLTAADCLGRDVVRRLQVLREIGTSMSCGDAARPFRLDKAEQHRLRKRLQYWRDGQHNEDLCRRGPENPESGRQSCEFPTGILAHHIEEILRKRT